MIKTMSKGQGVALISLLALVGILMLRFQFGESALSLIEQRRERFLTQSAEIQRQAIEGQQTPASLGAERRQ